MQVLRSLGLMADLDIDEMESLAQRVEMAKHQVRYVVNQRTSTFTLTTLSHLFCNP